MIIKFSKKEIFFLKNSFFKENADFELIIVNNNSIKLNEDLINEIRDWAGEKQQIIGFDENYALTNDGEILENIIDKLYF